MILTRSVDRFRLITNNKWYFLRIALTKRITRSKITRTYKCRKLAAFDKGRNNGGPHSYDSFTDELGEKLS